MRIIRRARIQVRVSTCVREQVRFIYRVGMGEILRWRRARDSFRETQLFADGILIYAVELVGTHMTATMGDQRRFTFLSVEMRVALLENIATGTQVRKIGKRS